ncbi:MAG TPA: VapE domain-containing protein [Bryobacteraceae bacterium]|nr:VapE domain-containing protein [Bryobacteraceae bacterium]
MQHKGIIAAKAVVGKAIQTVARDRPFHPIREYFERLKWDGRPRIDTWLPTYLGAAISDYHHAVGAKFLIGAVARVFQPGCKNDCCLVLEGPQGIMKSTALKVLADPWFTDEIADLGSKDSSMQVHGVLLVEIAELDAMQKSEVSRIKAFMSRPVDRYPAALCEVPGRGAPRIRVCRGRESGREVSEGRNRGPALLAGPVRTR